MKPPNNMKRRVFLKSDFGHKVHLRKTKRVDEGSRAFCGRLGSEVGWGEAKDLEICRSCLIKIGLLPDTSKTRHEEITIGAKKTTKEGYVYIYMGKRDWKEWVNDEDRIGWKPEHRMVMENYLERRLTPQETVHHKNGVRDDNRIENLEVWLDPPRPGIRASDLLCPHCGASYLEGYEAHGAPLSAQNGPNKAADRPRLPRDQR